MSDPFIDQLPFFTPGHRTLVTSIDQFVQREIEPRSIDEREADDRTREYLSLLAMAGVLRYAVSGADVPLDVRALCLIRESLAYSSALADSAFVMQGLGT